MVKTESLVSEAFALLGVQNFFDLMNAYDQEDQRLMKSHEWDAYNSTLIINQVKVILEQIDPNDLTGSDRVWRNEILWFWYHHAVSCEPSRVRAQAYATRALELQSDYHPNRITKLLWLLTQDKVDEAKQWMSEAPDDANKNEHQTGLDLIHDYEKKKIWE